MRSMKKMIWLISSFMLLLSVCVFGAEDEKVGAPPEQQALVQKLGETATDLESRFDMQKPFSGDALAKEYYVEGKRLYDEGKYEAALESLNKALLEDPASIQINYFIGKATFALGYYDRAVFAYERVLAIDPHHHISNLEKARAHAVLGQYKEARAAFEMTLEAELPSEVRQNIELYLATLTEVSRHKFSGVMMMGATWDSNATLGSGPFTTPLAGVLVSFDATDIGDFIVNQAIILNYQMRLYREQLFWKNSGLLLNTNYADQTSLDLQIGQISTGLNYLPLDKVVTELIFGLMYSRLDQSTYQVNPSGTFSVYYNYSPQVTYRCSYAYTKRRNFQTGSKPFGLLNAINPGVTLHIKEKNLVDLDYVYNFDKNPVPDNVAQVFRRSQVAAKFTRILNDVLSASLGGSWRHDNYLHILNEGNVYRIDNALSIDLGLSYKITPTLLLEGVYRHVDNDSTYAQNTYKSAQGAINLTYVF